MLLLRTLSSIFIHIRDSVVGTAPGEITVGYSLDRRTVPVSINFLCFSRSTSLTGDPNYENTECDNSGEVMHAVLGGYFRSGSVLGKDECLYFSWTV